MDVGPCVMDVCIPDLDNCYFYSIKTTQKQITPEIQLLSEEPSKLFLPILLLQNQNESLF